MPRIIYCKKLQQEAEGLDKPPFSGNLGQKIFENISKQAWNEWINHQTILINEYRISLADISSRKFLQQEMDKFLFGGGSEKPQAFTPAEK